MGTFHVGPKYGPAVYAPLAAPCSWSHYGWRPMFLISRPGRPAVAGPLAAA